MTDKLKPCPFCGNEATLGVGGTFANRIAEVMCRNYLCEVKFEVCYSDNPRSLSQANDYLINKWNTRI